MANTIPASGVLNAADSPAAAPAKHELSLDARVRARKEAPHVEHERRADLHRRTFAADRETAENRDERHRDLAEQNPQRKQAPARFGHRTVKDSDHLWNAAALGAAKECARDEHAQRGGSRRDDERQPEVLLAHVDEEAKTPVDEPRVIYLPRLARPRSRRARKCRSGARDRACGAQRKERRSGAPGSCVGPSAKR